MAVQEFMMEEVKDVAEDPQKGQEWSNLVEKLNLEGQRHLEGAAERWLASDYSWYSEAGVDWRN